MSCHGCRALRKRCSESCVLRNCLEWIPSPEAQGRATLFVSKFFGRNDLINFISSVPSHKRNALFQSLLFEAVGRTVNPVNGAIGLLSTGNWHLCQAAVRTVLAGGTPTVIVNSSQTGPGKHCSFPDVTLPPMNLRVASERSHSAMPASNISEFSLSFQCSDGDDPKLLNLFL